MQTQLPAAILATSSGRRADEILRACVHCGFCNATCPTYLLTGDELDGPRGRIYLIKDMLEAQAPTPIAREHLDRCLTCRACETTCPSGVAYGELAEIGRNFVEAQAPRPFAERFVRGALVRVLPSPGRLAFFARLGRLVRWAMPDYLARAVPRIRSRRAVAVKNHPRRVVVLEGCVQRSTTPGSECGAGARARCRGREGGTRRRRDAVAVRSNCTWARKRARMQRCAPTWMRCTKPQQTPKRSSPRLAAAA